MVPLLLCVLPANAVTTARPIDCPGAGWRVGVSPAGPSLVPGSAWADRSRTRTRGESTGYHPAPVKMSTAPACS